MVPSRTVIAPPGGDEEEEEEEGEGEGEEEEEVPSLMQVSTLL